MNVARFWREQPVRYNLYGTKCRKCGTVHFPPRAVCTKCKSTEVDKYQLKGTGKIESFTVIRTPPKGFEKEAPYVIALVRLDEGPMLTTQIIDCDIEEVKIGKKVKAVFRKIQEDGKTGAIYYGYKFKLAE